MCIRDRYYGFSRSKRKKKIVVIGGGPAGLQCASVAAKRGHKVTLLEKRELIGGNILLASKVDEGAIELLRPIKMLEGECLHSGVEIRLGIQYTPEALVEEGTDAIVIATGSIVKTFPLITSQNIFTPEDIIDKGKNPPKRTVIIGGEGVGLGIAVFLSRQGEYDLVIVEEGGRLGRDVNPFYLWQYLKLLKEKRVTLLTRSRVVGMEGKMLCINRMAEKEFIEVDGIIISQREPVKEWNLDLGHVAKEVYFIGDAKRPRRLHNAIYDGYRLGMML